MSLYSELQAAATEAQATLAEAQGMEATATGNFIGPDGQPYFVIFRAADAFETEAIGREMGSHGYNAKSVLIGSATRDQFDAAPLAWRQAKGTRLTPDRAEVTIVSVAIDDPLFYVFPMVVRQPATPSG